MIQLPLKKINYKELIILQYLLAMVNGIDAIKKI
jgi:hypothetical protein